MNPDVLQPRPARVKAHPDASRPTAGPVAPNSPAGLRLRDRGHQERRRAEDTPPGPAPRHLSGKQRRGKWERSQAAAAPGAGAEQGQRRAWDITGCQRRGGLPSVQRPGMLLNIPRCPGRGTFRNSRQEEKLVTRSPRCSLHLLPRRLPDAPVPPPPTPSDSPCHLRPPLGTHCVQPRSWAAGAAEQTSDPACSRQAPLSLPRPWPPSLLSLLPSPRRTKGDRCPHAQTPPRLSIQRECVQ